VVPPVAGVVVEVAADVPEFPLLPAPLPVAVPDVTAVVEVVLDFEPFTLLDVGVVVVVVDPEPVPDVFPSACCASVICWAMASMSA
jgi:hypothetical protein